MSDTTPRGRTGRKRPWLAALLAVLYPGLGHIYLRKWGRALLWFVVIITASTFLIPPDAVPSTLSLDALVDAGQAVPLPVSLAILTLTFLSMADAYWLARRTAEDVQTGTQGPATTTTDSETQTCPNCGKELDDDLDFCHWCTTELQTSAED
ncbi:MULTISPECIES: zinc ribbon domain-containing protein [Salinibaculum]|uniref:zinc ribbon domain-containing protein n=1 Tax=Salinibaculum TaxID=2732368 RepID=UPI0030CB109A